MAKGKKNRRAKSETPQSGSDTVAFPPKPVRTGKAPGTTVLLVTNMYRILQSVKKQCYRHTIQVELLGDAPGGSLAPRRIPRGQRRQAVNRAIGQWLETNPQRPSDAIYGLDKDASTMYSVFMMLEEHDGAPGNRKCLSIESHAQSEVTGERVPMRVTIYSPSSLNVSELFGDLAGVGPRSSSMIAEKYKALNVILTLDYMDSPSHLCVSLVGGGASILSWGDDRAKFQINQHAICRKGFKTSVRPTELGPVAVISNTCVPFFEPLSLLGVLKGRYGVRDFRKPLDKGVIDELRKEFKTKQVEVTHMRYPKKYRVHDIGGTTKEEKFALKDNSTGATTTISVFDYFKKEYSVTLRFPNLPCILDNKRQIPLEVCNIVDKQRISRKLEAREMSAVMKQTVMKPELHFECIRGHAADIKRHSEPMRDFGLEIEQKLIKARDRVEKLEYEPIEVEGRELPPIRLLAANGEPMCTSSGEYRTQKGQHLLKFARPATIKKWTLVVLADHEWDMKFRKEENFLKSCERFGSSYRIAGEGRGVSVGTMTTPIIKINLSSMDADSLMNQLQKMFVTYNRERFDHVIFVLPESKNYNWIYGHLQYLEVYVPRMIVKLTVQDKCTRTSCIIASNFLEKILWDERKASMFISNLWLKHNTKLGGVNFHPDGGQDFKITQKDRVNFLAPGYLFVSIDVCHPAPGDRLEQSVAAAVGMWNPASKDMSHCTRIRVQRKNKSDKEKSTVEQVGEIGIMFEEIVQSYKTRNQGRLPTHIVILRDGVSEGQFKMVLKDELGQIDQRIKTSYSSSSSSSKVNPPKLTCLNIQKRHQVRFMLKVPVKTFRGELDYNIQPGTVVDKTVVHPDIPSFYIAPHKAIKGTSRAPYVHILRDDIGFSQDAAQAMIFALSYMSPRCTKGTSIPTPINLADLAAERGKNIVVAWNNASQNRTRKLTDEERLAELNAFLSNMGDSQYHNTLYYV